MSGQGKGLVSVEINGVEYRVVVEARRPWWRRWLGRRS